MRTETLRNGKTVYMGFENFAEAETFAKENNGEIHSFKKRDGQEWRDEGKVYEPYNIKGFYNDRDYFYCYRKVEDEYEYYHEVVKNDLNEAEDIECAERMLRYHKRIIELSEVCGDDEFILDDSDELTIMPKWGMTLTYDVYRYEIGVIVEEEEL